MVWRSIRRSFWNPAPEIAVQGTFNDNDDEIEEVGMWDGKLYWRNRNVGLIDGRRGC